MTVHLLDVYRIWDRPDKGADAADAQAEMLAERVWDVLDNPDAIVDVPIEQVWYQGTAKRRVLIHDYINGVTAWVFSNVQQAERISAADMDSLYGALEDSGLHQQKAAKPGAKSRQQEPKTSDGPPWVQALAIDEIQQTYQINVGGVTPMSWDNRTSQWTLARNSKLCDRPLWPNRSGVDLANGDAYWQLGWQNPFGTICYGWIQDQEMRLASPLIALQNGPVTDGRHRAAAQWLTYAVGYLRHDPVDVCSRVGWVITKDRTRWIWPGGTTEYIGDELPLRDTDKGRVAWLKGLQKLVDLGPKGMVALAAVAISAAAPLSRIHKRRNPILGYVSRTSKGKGSSMGYACSLWTSQDKLMAPASSSAKGIQDMSAHTPDLPLWLDELQQMLEQGDRGKAQAMDALYYLANGVRRITSSKAQKAVGGDRRYGCGMYASEYTIIEGLNPGVQSRVIELTGDPCPDQETALILQRAATHHGAWGGQYGRDLEAMGAATIATRLETWSDNLTASLGDDSRLRGDDCSTVAMLCLGLQLLGNTVGIALPVPELEEFLLGHIEQQRRQSLDKESESLHRITSAVLSLAPWTTDWQKVGQGVDLMQLSCKTPNGMVGWRKSEMVIVMAKSGDSEKLCNEETKALSLEINPEVDPVRSMIREYGGEAHVLASWDARGWIDKDGNHRKHKKKHKGKFVGRVIRLSATALEMIHGS